MDKLALYIQFSVKNLGARGGNGGYKSWLRRNSEESPAVASKREKMKKQYRAIEGVQGRRGNNRLIGILGLEIVD